MHRFKYLKVSLMMVLLYVGVKMLASHYVKIPNAVSLLVIVTTLIVGVFASMARAEAPIAATVAIPAKLATWLRRNGRRIVVFVVGGTVLLTGVVMLTGPGPGVLVILAGLAILAAEFAWARRWLKRTRSRPEA
jgi:tellurite resistance protein TerC